MMIAPSIPSSPLGIPHHRNHHHSPSSPRSPSSPSNYYGTMSVSSSSSSICSATGACANADRCVASCAAYGRVCPGTARIAAQVAYETVVELRRDSTLFGPDWSPSKRVLQLEPNDVICQGKRLGEGGFSYVHPCSIISEDPQYAGHEYAMKFLKRKVMVDLHQFKHGAADLSVEAHFLQILNHDHIIQLHGIRSGDLRTNIASGQERGFFIIVDRLVDTLEERIQQWSEEREQNSGILARWSADYKVNKRKDLFARIRLALQIASAMEHLHNLNIAYRDLKPDNIGFDKDGVLKIFDFGLTKELKQKNHRFDGKFELTGNTGSRRYMAPEVAKDENYDKSVDVYSFGILLWELCSAEKPFFGYSSDKHMRQVVLGGERPKMDSVHTAYWPMNLQWLMTRCWSEDSTQRPSFTLVRQVLQDILQSKEAIPTLDATATAEAKAPSSDRHLPVPAFFRTKNSSSPPPLSPTGFLDILKPAAGIRRFKTTQTPTQTPASPATPARPTLPPIVPRGNPPESGALPSLAPLSNVRRQKTWTFGGRKK